MEINNSFEVPLPPPDTWKVLMDIPRIAPCMPGAELTGVVDKDTYNGKVSVKLGPVALTFAGQVKFTDIDEAAHKARVKAQGKDSKAAAAPMPASIFIWSRRRRARACLSRRT